MLSALCLLQKASPPGDVLFWHQKRTRKVPAISTRWTHEKGAARPFQTPKRKAPAENTGDSRLFGVKISSPYFRLPPIRTPLSRCATGSGAGNAFMRSARQAMPVVRNGQARSLQIPSGRTPSVSSLCSSPAPSRREPYRRGRLSGFTGSLPAGQKPHSLRKILPAPGRNVAIGDKVGNGWRVAPDEGAPSEGPFLGSCRFPFRPHP